jgi:hypothetical protein
MPAFMRLMDSKREHHSASTISPSDEAHFDGREMAMVHRMFRREFLLAGGVARQVDCSDTTRAHSVAAHLKLISSTLHHHHSGEDRYVWPLLESRAPAELSAHVQCVLQQHRRVDAVQAEVDEHVAAWSSLATEDSRERLAAALEQLAAALIEHMDYEGPEDTIASAVALTVSSVSGIPEFHEFQPIGGELKELVRQSLPVYNVPVDFAVVDDLPRNPALKVSLPAVVALYVAR